MQYFQLEWRNTIAFLTRHWFGPHSYYKFSRFIHSHEKLVNYNFSRRTGQRQKFSLAGSQTRADEGGIN